MRVLRNVEDVGGENLTGKLRVGRAKAVANSRDGDLVRMPSLPMSSVVEASPHQTFMMGGGHRRMGTERYERRRIDICHIDQNKRRINENDEDPQPLRPPQNSTTLQALQTAAHQATPSRRIATPTTLLPGQVLGFPPVVSKPSWTDKRLLAATVLVFLSGSFKYAVRTCCLYIARPAQIRGASMRILSDTLTMLKDATEDVGHAPTLLRTQRDLLRFWNAKFDLMLDTLTMLKDATEDVGHAPTLLRTQRDLLRFWNAKFDLMLGKSDKRGFLLEKEIYQDAKEIMSVDAPPNNKESVLLRDDLPNMLEKFQSTSCLHQPYDYVGRNLVKCYERFYTKMPLLRFFHTVGAELILTVYCSNLGIGKFIIFSTIMIIWLIVILLQNFPIPIALVLFTMAEKGNQIHNRADVTVSYILLIGAIILDVSSASMSILSFVGSNICRGRIKIMVLSVANYIQPTCCKRQWSEELAQYSMVKRYATGDARGMPYVRQWIGKRLIACGVELLDPSMTHTHVTEDLKGFVLNKLVQFGIKKQYNFADFRGQLALQEWRKNGPGTEALYYSINEVKDFPTSILIWHIATDICYYSGSSCTANTECDRSKKKKKLSRELSNYILYLVFKCGVMLTSSSELGHNKVYVEMKNVLRLQQPQMVNPREEAIMKVFEGVEDKQPHSTVNEEQEQPVDTDDTTSGQIKKLLESMADAIYFPILPHATKVAKELMGINDEGERWDLITAVWSDMLYYIAPRCGCTFHYQHLSTGGEFITHVLHLMHSLGPFLPGPGNSAPVQSSTLGVEVIG
uniref:Uncharacterized protein n=1 Tax=Aegilops tauschii TaxID=37682 RepID=M8BI14_AEGTA